MGIARLFVYGVLGGSFLFLFGGLLLAPFAECDRTFCVSPSVSIVGKVLGLKQPEMLTYQSKTPNEKAHEAVMSSSNSSPSIVLDYRLNRCPDGSIDSSVGELPATLVDRFKQELQEGLKLSSLVEVEEKLGKPNCSYQNQDVIEWRYLVQGGARIAVSESKKGVSIGFFRL